MEQKDIKELGEIIEQCIKKLDDMWSHEQDGSFLLVSNSDLFSITFNEVLDTFNKKQGLGRAKQIIENALKELP